MFHPIDDNIEIDTDYLDCSEYQLFINSMKNVGKNFHPDHWAGDSFSPGSAEKPTSGIKGNDAKAFCDWLTSQPDSIGYKYRLPKLLEAQVFEAQFLENYNSKLDTTTIGYWCTDKQDRTVLNLNLKAQEVWRKKLSESVPKLNDQFRERAQQLVELFSRTFYEFTFSKLDTNTVQSTTAATLSNNKIPALTSKEVSKKSILYFPLTSPFLRNVNPSQPLPNSSQISSGKQSSNQIDIEQIIQIIDTSNFIHTQSIECGRTIDYAYKSVQEITQELSLTCIKATQQVSLLSLSLQDQINLDWTSQAKAKELHLSIGRLLKRVRRLAGDYNFSISYQHDIYKQQGFHALLSEFNKICNLAYQTYGFDFLRPYYQCYANTKNINQLSKRRIRQMFISLTQHLENAYTLTKTLAQQRTNQFDEFINSLEEPQENCKLAKELVDKLLLNIKYELTLERFGPRELSPIDAFQNGFSWRDIRYLLRKTYADINYASSHFENELSSLETEVLVDSDPKMDVLDRVLFNFLVAYGGKLSLTDFHGFIKCIGKKFDLNINTYPDKVDLGFVSNLHHELQKDFTSHNQVKIEAVCSYVIIIYHLWNWLHIVYGKYILERNLPRFARLNEEEYQAIWLKCAAKREEALNLYAFLILIVGQINGAIPILGGLRLAREKVALY